MPFQTSINSLPLSSSEDILLSQIDAHVSKHLGGIRIGDVHKNISVRISSQTPTRPYKFTITQQQQEQQIASLANLCNKIRAERANLPFGARYDEERCHLELEECAIRSSIKIYESAYQYPDGSCEIVGQTKLLGEYIDSSKEVVLYIKNIRDDDYYKSDFAFIAVVYIHELMHALFARTNVGRFIGVIEEPIVEYTVLKLLEEYGDASLLKFASNLIEEKKYVLGCAHYGFGHYLYSNGKGVNWSKDYSGANLNAILPNQFSKKYKTVWEDGSYPFNTEHDTLILLYYALHNSNSVQPKITKTTMATTSTPKAGKATLFKKDEFKAWLLQKGYSPRTAGDYVTYVGYPLNGRDLTEREIKDHINASEKYEEFLKSLL